VDWSDQTSALWTLSEAADAGARRLFLKKILRVVVDFDEEL